MPTVQTIIRRLFGMDRARMDVLSIEGRTAGGDHRLRIFYAHEPCSFLSYVENVAYASEPNKQPAGSIRPWEAEKLARRHGYDLVLVFGWNAPLVGTVFRDFFFLPQWVSAEVDLERDAVYKGNSPSRRRDIRKLSTNNFSYRITTSDADLEHFYRAMYLPTIKAAHGDAAVLMPIDSMLDRVRAGESELVSIEDDVRPVAGSLIVYDDGEPRLLSLGVLNADRAYYRAGAGSAIYLFSFQHLLDKGFDRVDIGRTRPFLRDGTLYFKRRLGMRVTAGTEHGFFMKPLNNSAGVQEFLCSSPFMYANRNGLRGLAFFQSESQQRDAALLDVPGLTRFDAIDVRRQDLTGSLAIDQTI